MTEIEKAIREFEYYIESGYGQDERPSSWSTAIALSALRAKQKRENPKPLTVDELKECVGKPVWIQYISVKYHDNGETELIEVKSVDDDLFEFWHFGDECESELSTQHYEKTFLIYDHKPKERENNESLSRNERENKKHTADKQRAYESIHRRKAGTIRG